MTDATHLQSTIETAPYRPVDSAPMAAEDEPYQLTCENMGLVAGDLIVYRSVRLVLAQENADPETAYNNLLALATSITKRASDIYPLRGGRGVASNLAELQEFTEHARGDGLIVMRHVDYSGQSESEPPHVADFLADLVEARDHSKPMVAAIGYYPLRALSMRPETPKQSASRRLFEKFACEYIVSDTEVQKNEASHALRTKLY